jgi:four helix bundle protein
MARIQTVKDLRVWQSAMDVAMEVFEHSRRFPIEERFSLTDQIRRASRSVAANISEAWRKRRYPAAFIAKLSDAEAEAAETQTWIELALRCGYLTPEQAATLDRHCDEILAQLVHMITHPKDWTLPDPRP